MADQRFVRSYAALERHHQEMHNAVRQRRRRMLTVLGCGVGATAFAYWLLPPLALLVAGVSVLAGFFASITGSSSVPADQMTGAEGEAKVLRALSALPDEFILFNQVQIPDPTLPNGRREIDFLVVAPSALFIIEVKNSAGLIYVRPQESRWPLAHKAGCGGRPGWNVIANPLGQVRAQADALDRWLLREGQTAPIHPLICFARSDVALRDKDDSPMPILTLPELVAHLSGSPQQPGHRHPEKLVKLLSKQSASGTPGPSAALGFTN